MKESKDNSSVFSFLHVATLDAEISSQEWNDFHVLWQSTMGSDTASGVKVDMFKSSFYDFLACTS